MEKIIYFEDNIGKYCVIRFVKNFRKKSYLRKERIEYTLSYSESLLIKETDDIDIIQKRIKKDYPNATVYHSDCGEFMRKYKLNEFWVIAHLDNDYHIDGYYSGMTKRSYSWNEDISDTEIYLDYSNTEETLSNIRRATGDKWCTRPIYINLINGLLEPNFMITCTSKRGENETKYFKKIEGGRLRLVKASDNATRFTYEQVWTTFDYLRENNRNFLYAVLPVFKENVNYKHIDDYVREKKVSRMVQMTMKLKMFRTT